MKLSVILPYFNSAKTIALQLEALAHQCWSEPWELVVVNNGSTDDSMQIVESYRNLLPNLRIVDAYVPPAPRLGVSHSYNVGVQAAKGDAVAFCEADDEVAPDWLVTVGTALDRYDFVSGALEYQRLNEPWIVEAHGSGAQSQELVAVGHKPYLPFAYGCNLGMKRAVYETVGEFDESFPCAWDMDYSFRAQLAGFQLHFVPNLVVHYRVRHKWRDIYRQSRNWGEDNPLVRKRYGAGMGKLELPNRTIALLGHLLKVWQVSNRTAFASWLFSFGWQVGEIQGLLKHFVWGLFSDHRNSGLARRDGLKFQAR